MNEGLTEYEWEGHRGSGISEYLTQMRGQARGRAEAASS